MEVFVNIDGLTHGERRAARVAGFDLNELTAKQLDQAREYLRIADEIGITFFDSKNDLKRVQDAIRLEQAEAEAAQSPSEISGILEASSAEKAVAGLIGFDLERLTDQDILLTRDYLSVADQIGIGQLDTKDELARVQQVIGKAEASTEKPQNLIIFIRDQVKPEDLWLPRGWAEENLPTRQWLLDNGLSFENSFTNTAMCSSARATFFTGKYPAQHGLDLLLSDIENPILDSQVQLNPDLPTLGTVLLDQGYDVSFFGKAHLSKTFTMEDGEVVYQDMNQYDFKDWQGPDAGQDMDPKNAGGGYADNDSRFIDEAVKWLGKRFESGNEKPFAMVVSLVNPHDVLSYPRNWGEGDPPDPDKFFGYPEEMIEGDIDLLPPTVDEDLTGSLTIDGFDYTGNFKPQIQGEWLRAQFAAQPLLNDQMRLNYLNFYGNLMEIADRQMGDVIKALGRRVDDTMFVSTADHGEMGMSHGGMVQKMFNAYEESIRVPMIWSNPKYFKGGQTSDALVSLVDFLPTVAGFYGSSQEQLSGYDLRGVDYSSILERASKGSALKHDNLDVQSSIVYTYDDIYAGQDPRNSIPEGAWDHGLLPGPNRLQAVRTKDFKYVRYYSADEEYSARNWQGELYDLRVDGGDYYPLFDGEGDLNPFKPGPLEMRNLDPKAEALRVLQGGESIATPEQQLAYFEMSNLLDQLIGEKLQPMLPFPSVAPSIFEYQGGSSDDPIYGIGDPIVRLIPGSNGTQDLELAFNTRAGQTYNLVAIDRSLNSETGSLDISIAEMLVPNIIGTNGPAYQYLRGLPADARLSDYALEWLGGFVPLESFG